MMGMGSQGTPDTQQGGSATRFGFAEFFAGIGLVGMGLQRAGFEAKFANDIDPVKRAMFSANFDTDVYWLRDIREVHGSDVPDVPLATASFPCTDLSLAGNRNGLAGSESGLLWEFLRVLEEMGERRPSVVLLENVIGFANSHGGADFLATLRALNGLSYVCDALVLDAKHFVPQSRPRLFIVASHERLECTQSRAVGPLRPRFLQQFRSAHPDVRMQTPALPVLPQLQTALDDVVEGLNYSDERWWPLDRVAAFIASMSTSQRLWLEAAVRSNHASHMTAYRRTREGRAVWEVRHDGLAGCLRTTRGGSSKQALVECGQGKLAIRWLTAVEYGRLQGANGFHLDGTRENQARFAFGDAVCVPVVAWLGEHYLRPLVGLHRPANEERTNAIEARGLRSVSAPAAAR